MATLPFDVGEKPMGILNPDDDAQRDLERIRDMRDEYGPQSVQYQRGLQEALNKHGGYEQFAGKLGLSDGGRTVGDAYSPSLQPGERAPITEERSGSLPPMSPPQNVGPPPGSVSMAPTPAQRPTSGVNDPMGRLGTPQGAGAQVQEPTMEQARRVLNEQAGIADLLGSQGQGQGQQQQARSQPTGPGLSTLLGGLAAGAAQAGNMPHFGNALASAAAGGRAATQQAEQQAFERQMSRAQLQAELAQAARQGDRTQFERVLDQAGLSDQQKQEFRRQWLIGQVSDTERGVTVEQGPDGGFTIKTNAPQGGGSGSDNQTATKNQLEEELVKIEDRISRIEDIEETYESDFLNTFERLKLKGAAFWEKLAGEGSLGDETERKLRNYTVFQANALDNLNRYIHEMTGAQLSQFEAERLRAPLPDPGEGAIARMSPTQFEGALARIKETAQNSKKRKEYLMRNGLLSPGQEVTENLARQYPLSIFDEDGEQSLNQIQDMSTDKLQQEYQRLREQANEQDLGKQRRRELARRAQVVVDELNSREGQ